ncbi:MAG: ring-opening amidohydrolase, partial [Gammaproteobacteria bacterium]
MHPWIYDLWRIPVSDPGDVGGLRERLQRNPEWQVLAVMGKTEGNGCVNDFSRTLAARAYKDLLLDFAAGGSTEPLLIMSGGTEGVLSPHVSVFVRRPVRSDDEPGPALVCGTARTADIPVSDLGRMGQVGAVADATRAALDSAGISDPADVHLVQIKCPLLTDARIHQALAEGRVPVTEDTYLSMAYSRGASALGVALALGEVDAALLDDARICRDWELFSSVASMSAGAELTACEVLVLGNSSAAYGPLRIGHAVMADPVDAAAVRVAMASAGAAETARVRQVFAKADPVAV